MNKIDTKFKDLLDKTLVSKTGQFDSRFLFKRLKVKNKELTDIISMWIDQLIMQNKIGLINLGKGKTENNLYMTEDFFLDKIKKYLLTLDFLQDENSTYSFFLEVTETKNPNTDLLVNKIKHLLRPLVKFDHGSRNVPIMFNLYKLFVPERMINISDQMMDKVEVVGIDAFSESRQVKKMMFKSEKNQEQNFSDYQVILTAISYILLERGRLILTKDEIIESRGYKVFFNSPGYSTFTTLIKKIYPFNPYISQDFISFFPENWLDIEQIDKQIKSEDPETFIKKHFVFLDQEEILILLKLLNSKEKEPKQKEKQQDISEDSKKEKKEKIIPQLDKEIKKDESRINNNNITNKILKTKNLKKKKSQKSEPLTFLNEIIYKEKENKNYEDPKIKKNKQGKEKIFKDENLFEKVKRLDKTQKHFLLCILDSTKIESGYYSHSKDDKKFIEFLEDSIFSDLFEISEEDESIILKRKLHIADEKYKELRKELEKSILKSENNPIEEQESEKKESEKKESEKKESEKKDMKTSSDTIQPDEVLNQQPDSHSTETLLKDLLINEHNDSKTHDNELSDNKQESIEQPIFIENRKDLQEENKLDMDQIDQKVFFEITGGKEDVKEDDKNNTQKPSENQEKLKLQKNENMNEEISEVISNDFTEEGDLEGKIISVLTDDQEKWLKIKLISSTMGFELRDGLAYKPDIAVFDEGFSHLEPIARNTGAIILPLRDFMKKLGLRDTH